MKLGLVNKFDKRKRRRQKKKYHGILSTNKYVIVIFQFKVNLEHSRSMVSLLRTPDAWSADISKIKEVQILKEIFSESTYVCLLAYQISSL